jgi:hypothetical protein
MNWKWNTLSWQNLKYLWIWLDWRRRDSSMDTVTELRAWQPMNGGSVLRKVPTGCNQSRRPPATAMI